MAKQGTGRFYQRKDGQVFLFISKAVTNDSAFPIKTFPSDATIEIVEETLAVKIVVPVERKTEEKK